MRTATRIVAAWLGIASAAAGLEHGYFEILQGNVPPASLMFASMGPPCVPEKIWNACEPAMSLIPSFLISGILAVVVSLLVLIWSVWFVQREQGGLVLILLCVILLLCGGGFFPPLFGVIGGAAGTQINKPLGGRPAGGVLRFAAKLWPWPLVIFVGWAFGQFPVGYFFNDLLKSNMLISLPLIVAMLPLSVYTGYAHDIGGRTNQREERP